MHVVALFRRLIQLILQTHDTLTRCPELRASSDSADHSDVLVSSRYPFPILQGGYTAIETVYAAPLTAAQQAGFQAAERVVVVRLRAADEQTLLAMCRVAASRELAASRLPAIDRVFPA